jgi:hypothetical protein
MTQRDPFKPAKQPDSETSDANFDDRSAVISGRAAVVRRNRVTATQAGTGESQLGTNGETSNRPPSGGFFAKLFDYSFNSFITTSIVRAVYVLATILAGIASVAVFVALAREGGSLALTGVVAAPLIFFLVLINARLYLELVIVIFKIAEDTDIVARHSQR